MIVLLSFLLLSAADAATETPPYALDRKQLEPLLRSLGRPVREEEIDETELRLRFYRPPNAATLLRMPEFVKETDELWREVFERPPTAAELFNIARWADVVGSRRYVKSKFENWRPAPRLSFVCFVKDPSGNPARNALLIEISTGLIRRTDAAGRALFDRTELGAICSVHEAADGGFHKLYDQLEAREKLSPPEYVLRRLQGTTASGIVRDDRGRPLSNVLMSLRFAFRYDSFQMPLFSVTDSNGRFTVKWIHPHARVTSIGAERLGYRS
ncbi:MAG TPA: hypothetical protein VNC50_22825, partial [Planctomycetia bacterium]|nr:hypothetical protein [Planctomycetia bacterium]